MTRNEIALVVLFLIAVLAVWKKNTEVEALNNKIDYFTKIVSENDLRFISNEEKLSVIEQAVDAKSRKWAKVKQVRNIILEELQCIEEQSRPQINEITEIASSAIDYADEHNVKLSLVLAIIRRESHFNPLAHSPTGASGVMQLVSTTAQECANDLNKKFYNIFKIRDNIQLGSFYIWKMLNRFKNNEELAVRAYNAGPILVEKVMSGEIKDYPEETKKYVIDVMESKKKYENKGL